MRRKEMRRSTIYHSTEPGGGVQLDYRLASHRHRIVPVTVQIFFSENLKKKKEFIKKFFHQSTQIAEIRPIYLFTSFVPQAGLYFMFVTVRRGIFDNGRHQITVKINKYLTCFGAVEWTKSF